MSIQLFSAAERKTINWASGTSTEIFIYPADGNFAERDFTFRISTATVEAEESVFTFFEGITRHLMILKGTLELTHEGRYTKIMEPYVQDTFSGEWPTRSKGKVTDFNLMLKNGATGSLTHYNVNQGNHISFTSTAEHYFIYIASGKAAFGNNAVAQQGDLLRAGINEKLSITALENCNLIVIEVLL